MMTVHSADEYATALRKLLPRGDFWDKQLVDPESDTSLWCDSKAAELARFRSREAALLDEAFAATTTELIDNWEKVNGIDNATLEFSVRKELLMVQARKKIDRVALGEICAMYKASLDLCLLPYSPAFYGRSRFNHRIAGPSAFATIHLYIALTDQSLKNSLELTLDSALTGHYIPSFFYR